MADLSGEAILEMQAKDGVFQPFCERTEIFWCPIVKEWIDWKSWQAHRTHLVYAIKAEKRDTFWRKLMIGRKLHNLYTMYGFSFFDTDSDDMDDGEGCRYNTPEEAYANTKRLSYGLGPCTYDMRIAHDIWVWPLYGRLGYAMERMKIPNYVNAKIFNKSSIARMFWDASKTTLADPGFEGYLTIEVSSDRPWPRKIKKGTPIVQVLFTYLDRPTARVYRGKYSNQEARPVEAR